MFKAAHTGGHQDRRCIQPTDTAGPKDKSPHVVLTEPVPTTGQARGSTKPLWIAIIAALFVFSALGAYMLRTHNLTAAAAPADPTPPASTAAPSPDQAAANDGTTVVSAKSEAIAARTAEQVWMNLGPVGQQNLCKAWNQYPKEAIRGAFLKMAVSPKATFTVEGAAPVQVWSELRETLQKAC